MSNKKTGKIIRDVDLRQPKQLQHNDLLDLSEAHNLTIAQRDWLANSLGILVEAFAHDISKRKKCRSRADDRKNLIRAIDSLRDAQHHLRACGPIGQEIVRKNVSDLGEMLSTHWLRQSFPKFDLPKEFYTAGRSRSRLTLRGGELVDIEEHTFQYRRNFAGSHNTSFVATVLNAISQSLKGALKNGRKRAGRNNAEFRIYFVMNLASFWRAIGRDPKANGPYQFPQFCDHVLNYVGWPTTGLTAVIRKARANLLRRS